MDETQLKAALEKTSKIYDKLKPKWDKCRIVYEGEDAVHNAGVALLPKLGGQDDLMYQSYVERTRFLNAFKRTVLGLEGTVNRKTPDTEFSYIEGYLDNIDAAGTTIYEYADKILQETIKIGPCGTLVDYSESFSNDEMTIAEVENLSLRPKLDFYYADNILYPTYGVVDGVKQLVSVKLLESYEYRKNEFESETYPQYRVLRINDEGYYEQQLYKITPEGGVDVSDIIVPHMDDEKLRFIPFYLHGEFVEPPMYDLVTNNIKHYQLKADHNHALHFIGLPTPYRTGVDPEDSKLPTTIGPETIWDIEEADAKVGFLELEGRGLDHIDKELKTIKDDMAFLGAAMLSTDELVNETATKAMYRNASETSSLAGIVISNSGSFSKALTTFAKWASGDKDAVASYIYNDDFDMTGLSAQELLAVVQGWQLGAYSKQSMYKQLERKEFSFASKTYEDEQELINKGE